METIKNYDDYEIDIWGNVRSKKKEMFLNQRLRPDGFYYYKLTQNKKQTYIAVHRLLALQFIENPDNLPVVDHIDGNRLNNDIDNLRWVDKNGHYNRKEVKGYTFYKKTKRWRAQYQNKNKQKIHIGYYDTEDEARNAYLNAIKYS